jgi:formylglycine-generating enzyme required for sulfatase activity
MKLLIAGITVLVAVCSVAKIHAQHQPTTLPSKTPIFDSFGFEMVYVPTGAVQMGIGESKYFELVTTGILSEVTGGSSIGSQREMGVFDIYETIVYGFWIDKYELSVAAYDNFTLNCISIETCSESLLPQLLTWEEAVQFCASRNSRLPREDEWEYAASGPKNLIFPWGNNLDAELLANDSYTSFSLYEVGTKNLNVSWVGVFDMAGNAEEWTDDLFRPYQIDSDTELSEWHITWTEYARVTRGGSAEDSILDKTTYSRQGAFYSTAGVRCVRNSDPTE